MRIFLLGLLLSVLIGHLALGNKCPLIFFDLTADDKPIGRVVIKLYSDIVPKTAENFRQLSTCENPKLCYKGTEFHRVIPDFMAQGGDFKNSKSIYGEKFDDENFKANHDRPGTLSMANSGPNTNGAQFFITFRKYSSLDGKHVVFGEVTEGMDVVCQIEDMADKKTSKTSKKVVIKDSGQLQNTERGTGDNAEEVSCYTAGSMPTTTGSSPAMVFVFAMFVLMFRSVQN